MSKMNKYKKRPVRLNIPGHAHELTFSCYKGKSFLKSEKAKEFLAEAIIRAREKYKFHVWAYVFMPNHVHLLIKPLEEEYSISKILNSIKQPVSRKVINFLKASYPDFLRQFSTDQTRKPFRFWQKGGGYDRNMVSQEVVRAAINYIHNNPVRKELVQLPSDWKWSSYVDWENLSEGFIPIDKDSLDLW